MRTADLILAFAIFTEWKIKHDDGGIVVIIHIVCCDTGQYLFAFDFCLFTFFHTKDQQCVGSFFVVVVLVHFSALKNTRVSEMRQIIFGNVSLFAFYTHKCT